MLHPFIGFGDNGETGVGSHELKARSVIRRKAGWRVCVYGVLIFAEAILEARNGIRKESSVIEDD